MDESKKKIMEAFAMAIADGKGWIVPFQTEEEKNDPNDIRNIILKMAQEKDKGKA
jgi:hypothetical protein